MSEPTPEYDDGRPAAPAPPPVDVAEVAFFQKNPPDMMAAWREAAADALEQLVRRGQFQLGDRLVLGGEIRPTSRLNDRYGFTSVVLHSVEGAARVELVRGLPTLGGAPPARPKPETSHTEIRGGW